MRAGRCWRVSPATRSLLARRLLAAQPDPTQCDPPDSAAAALQPVCRPPAAATRLLPSEPAAEAPAPAAEAEAGAAEGEKKTPKAAPKPRAKPTPASEPAAGTDTGGRARRERKQVGRRP